MKLAVWCVKYMGTLHCISPPSTDTSLRRSRFRCAFLEFLSLSLETGTESRKNFSGTSHCNKKMWENLHWKIETCETPILSNPAHTSLQKTITEYHWASYQAPPNECFHFFTPSRSNHQATWLLEATAFGKLNGTFSNQLNGTQRGLERSKHHPFGFYCVHYVLKL